MKRIVVGNREGLRDLLLLPGNDQAAEFYRSLAETLACHGFSTTLLTLPGFHREPPLPRTSWITMMARIHEAIDRELIVVGHSLGGLMGLLAAAHLPARVTHLVLMEPAIPPGRFVAAAMVRRYRRQVVDADRATFTNFSGSFYRIHDPARFPREMIDLYLEVRRTSDPAVSRALIESLPALYPLPFDRVRAPVLLLHGESSGWATKLGLLYLTQKLPGLIREEVRGAAHWMANEQDETIASAIARFVTRPAGAS